MYLFHPKEAKNFVTFSWSIRFRVREVNWWRPVPYQKWRFFIIYFFIKERKENAKKNP